MLPPAELARFAADVTRAIEACAELGDRGLVARTVEEWEVTAAIHADPELHARLTGPVDGDLGPVVRPNDCC